MIAPDACSWLNLAACAGSKNGGLDNAPDGNGDGMAWLLVNVTVFALVPASTLPLAIVFGRIALVDGTEELSEPTLVATVVLETILPSGVSMY